MIQNVEHEKDLAERIARVCIQQYSRLGKQGKPRLGQWTVLAGVVLQSKDRLEVISLATGEKSWSTARR
jgi:hypothetical protein